MDLEESRDMEACGWDDDFWEEIGLGDLVEGHHSKIGQEIYLLLSNLGSHNKRCLKNYLKPQGTEAMK